MKRLNDSKSKGKVPAGLVVKGRNSQPLQECFDVILQETELKLFDATIEALIHDKQHCKERCANEKEKVTVTVCVGLGPSSPCFDKSAILNVVHV